MWAASYPCLGAGNLTEKPPSLAVAPSFSLSSGLLETPSSPRRKKIEKKTQAAMSALQSLCGGTCENIHADCSILTWQG